jgi:prephenate dehydratase
LNDFLESFNNKSFYSINLARIESNILHKVFLWESLFFVE